MMMRTLFLLALLVPLVFAMPTTVPAPNGEPPVRYSSPRRVSDYTQAAKAAVIEQAVRSNVIITSSFPIKFEGINYFWYGSYMYDASHPQKCEYLFMEEDVEFANITFADGSKPPSLQFGCLSFQDCCGMQCCGDSRTSTLVILGAIVAFLFVYWLLRKYSRARAKRSLITMADTNPVTPLRRHRPRFETHSV